MSACDAGERAAEAEPEGGGADPLVPEQSVLAEPLSDVTESVPVRAAQEKSLRDEENTSTVVPGGPG